MTLSSSAIRSAVRGQGRRPRAGHGDRGQRQAGPQLLGPCGRSDRPSTPHGRCPCGPPGRRRGQAGHVGPVGQVHAALTGEAPVDRLGEHGQQRRHRPAKGVQHGVQDVVGGRLGIESDAWLAPTRLQKRSRLRRMYQLLRASRNAVMSAHAPVQVVGVHGVGDFFDQQRAAWTGCNGPAPRRLQWSGRPGARRRWRTWRRTSRRSTAG